MKSNLERVSRPGKYSGYSKKLYNEVIRTSLYIAVRDETKLAADIWRPARDGVPVSKPHPVIWTQTPYHRSRIVDGEITTYHWFPIDLWAAVIKYGYVLATLDIRGRGASYGTWHPTHCPTEARDSYDVTEWFAAQPWCNGNVGMWGGSYMGVTQYHVASTKPPHLKAIFPECSFFDSYLAMAKGGVFIEENWRNWSDWMENTDMDMSVTPVDDDVDKSRLAEAVEQHNRNILVKDEMLPLRYRDSRSGVLNIEWYKERSPSSYITEIQEWGGAVYDQASWIDNYCLDHIISYTNSKNNPRKLLIGPWRHCEATLETTEFNMFLEHLRWYDYWLKGIDNGVLDEPPIYYYTSGKRADESWSFADQWPLPNEKRTNFYFGPGPSSFSCSSVNEGTLLLTPSDDSNGKDDYTVDYSFNSRNTGYEMDTGAMHLLTSSNDAKGLTYTMGPLKEDLQITGHPVAHIWVSSIEKDVVLFAYVEEGDIHGVTRLVSWGVLRASQRKLADPPYDYMGLPWHRCFKEDEEELPEHPVELVFDLSPCSKVIHKGKFIRVTISCSDKFADIPVISPAPVVTVYRSPDRASFVTLPVIPVSTP